MLLTCFYALGTSQAAKNGTDVLLDILSIGTPPAQSSSSTLDIFSLSQNQKTPVASLDGLSTPSPVSARAASPQAASPIIDLLDGLGPSPTAPGNILSVLGHILESLFRLTLSLV